MQESSHTLLMIVWSTILPHTHAQKLVMGAMSIAAFVATSLICRSHGGVLKFNLNPMREKRDTSNTMATTEQPRRQHQRPRCTVILREVTKDRFIHYLLRPATALGANEVIWVGAMKAKGCLRGGPCYGRAMRRELTVPLKNLNSMFQIRRYLTEEQKKHKQQPALRLKVIGVMLRPSLEVQSQPAHRFDFTFAGDVDSVALYFSGGAGQLTVDEARECDAVVHLLPTLSTNATLGDAPFSALLSVALHQVCVGLGDTEAAQDTSTEKFTTIHREQDSSSILLPDATAEAPSLSDGATNDCDFTDLFG